MKKKTFLTAILCIIMTVSVGINAFAEVKPNPNDWRYGSARTVFVDDNNKEIDEFSYFGTKDLSLIYIPLSFTFCLSKIDTSYTYKSDELSCTIEQTDNYSGIKSYYSVWKGSKKLRISGHDETLAYEPIFFNDVDVFSNGKIGSLVFISLNDFMRIYGLDKNYWAEKNTVYFTRNGNSLFEKYRNMPTTTQKSSSSSTKSSGSNYSSNNIPDFTAVTGIKSSGSNAIYGTEYSNVSKANIDKYVAKLLENGYSHAVTGPIQGDIFGYVEFSRYIRVYNAKTSIVSINKKKAVNSKYTIAISVI